MGGKAGEGLRAVGAAVFPNITGAFREGRARDAAAANRAQMQGLLGEIAGEDRVLKAGLLMNPEGTLDALMEAYKPRVIGEGATLLPGRKPGAPVPLDPLAGSAGYATDGVFTAPKQFAPQAPARPQFAQIGNGGYGVFNPNETDPAKSFSVVQQPQAPRRDAPAGYEWAPDGVTLKIIPGGPADPKVVGARAAAGRAPRGSGVGGARGASGVPPLPPGYVMEK